MNKHRFYVYASQLAPLIGQSPYEIVEPFVQFWKNNNREMYDAAVAELKEERSVRLAIQAVERQKLEEAIRESVDETLKQIHTQSLEQLVATVKRQEQVEVVPGESAIERVERVAGVKLDVSAQTSSASVLEQQTSIIDSVMEAVPDLDKEAQKDITRQLTKLTNCAYGQVTEDHAINRYSQYTNRTVVHQQKSVAKAIYSGMMGSLEVVGKVDGMVKLMDGEMRIVEIKNRQRRLFKDIAKYEKLQVHCYMFASGTKSCDLFQMCDTQCSLDTILFDTKWWTSTIVPACQRFVQRFQAMMSPTCELARETRKIILGGSATEREKTLKSWLKGA